MAKVIHVNGEALIRTGTGAANALEDLGVSLDGVTITLHEHSDKIFTDTFGPDVPFDEQYFLMDATVRATLIFYDDAVLGHIRSRQSGTDGTIGAAGTLWGGGSKYFRVLILSPTDSLPFNFPNARMEGGQPQKVGTKRTQWDVTFYAVPYSGASGSSSGTVLFNRTTT